MNHFEEVTQYLQKRQNKSHLLLGILMQVLVYIIYF